MKTAIRALAIVVCGCLAVGGAGCKRQAPAHVAPQNLQEGVQQLRAALTKASSEVQNNVLRGVAGNIRYGRYAEALAALDQLAGDPTLNEGQKKLVSDVSDLVKAKMAGEGAGK